MRSFRGATSPLLAAVLILAGCGDNGFTAPERIAAAAIELQPDSLVLEIDADTTIAAVVLDSAGTRLDRTVTWSSRDTLIADVTIAGVVRARSPGKTFVFAAADGVVAVATVEVLPPPVTGSDSFATNSLGEYTLHSQFTWNPAQYWTVEDGWLIVDGPSHQTVAIRNGLEFRDGWVEAELDYADDAGLVLRFLDNSNHYLLAIRDDASAQGLPHNMNLQLWKKEHGAYTDIGRSGGTDLEWARGTKRTFRFEVVGWFSIFRAQFDALRWHGR